MLLEPKNTVQEIRAQNKDYFMLSTTFFNKNIIQGIVKFKKMAQQSNEQRNIRNNRYLLGIFLPSASP